MDVLLRYAVTTEPFPLRANVADNLRRVPLRVIGTNPASDPDENPVVLQGVAVSIPLGSAGNQLTTDAKGIGPVAPSGWRMLTPNISDSTAEFVFEPVGGPAKVGSGSIEFKFENVVVNTEPGTLDLTVLERSGDCDDDCPSTDLALTKFPSGWGDVAFWATPIDVPRGSGTTLHWAGPADATYTIQWYDWRQQVDRTLPEAGSKLAPVAEWPGPKDPQLSLTHQTVFTLDVVLTADGHTYTARQQQIVTVEDARLQIDSIKAVPDYVWPTAPVSLQWKTENAKSWVLSGPSMDDTPIDVPAPDIQGFQTEPGFTVTPPPGPSRYTLTAQDAQGNQLLGDAPVTVDAQIIVTGITAAWEGREGYPGAPGFPGAGEEQDASPGGTGGTGDKGPAISVVAGQHRGLIQVAVTADGAPSQTLVIAPTGHLTVQSIGGSGGDGGPGGPGGWNSPPGGLGGTGGRGGDVTVSCPVALKPRVQSLITAESLGGNRGTGGLFGDPNPTGRRVSDGTPGLPGNVAWIDI